MSVDKKKNLRTILALAWPTMLEQLMQTAVQYIDLAMVGVLGTAATAAIGSTTTVNWLVNSSVSAIGIGFLAYIAKALGAEDKEKAARASAQSVFITLIIGFILTAITLSLSGLVPVWMQVDENIRPLASTYFFIIYLPMLPRAATTVFSTVLRASGDTKTPMQNGIVVNSLNVVLNFIMIYPERTVDIFGHQVKLYGMGLGVTGAAIASAIAFTVGGVLITVSLWKSPVVSPRHQRLLPDKNIILPCMRVAIPNMLQRVGTCLGYVAFASMINSLGEISTAAHTIANTVESAFYIPGYGMQTASATLAGNALGAKDRELLKVTSRQILFIEILLMIFSGGLLFIFAPQMMNLFTSDATVIALGAIVLRMVAVSEPFFGISIVLEGMMQGMGKTARPLIYNLIGMWGIRIIGTFICTQMMHMGLASAWICMIAHNLFLCGAYLVFWYGKKNKI